MKSFGAKIKGLVSSSPSTIDLNYETARKEYTQLAETINKTYESLLKHDKNLQKTFIHPSSLNKNILKYFPSTHPLNNYSVEVNKTIEASFNEWTQSQKANYDYIQQYLARSKFIKDSITDRDKALEEVDKSASKIKSLKDKPSKDLHKLQGEQNTYNAKRESFITLNKKSLTEISQFFEDKIDYFDWPLQNILLSLSNLFSTISSSHDQNAHIIEQTPPYYNPVIDFVNDEPTGIPGPENEVATSSSMSSSGSSGGGLNNSINNNVQRAPPSRPSPQPTPQAYQPQPQQVNSYQQPNQYQQPSPPQPQQNQYDQQYQQPNQYQQPQQPPQQYGGAAIPPRPVSQYNPQQGGQPPRPAPPTGSKPSPYGAPQQYNPQGGQPTRPPPPGGVSMFPPSQQPPSLDGLSLNPNSGSRVSQPPQYGKPAPQQQQQQYAPPQQYAPQQPQQQQYAPPQQYAPQQQGQQPPQPMPSRPKSTQFKPPGVGYSVPRPAGGAPQVGGMNVPQPNQQQMNQAGGMALNAARNPAVQGAAYNAARNPAVQGAAYNAAQNY